MTITLPDTLEAAHAEIRRLRAELDAAKRVVEAARAIMARIDRGERPISVASLFGISDAIATYDAIAKPTPTSPSPTP